MSEVASAFFSKFCGRLERPDQEEPLPMHSLRWRQRVALLLVVALSIPACGGAPRIQTTLAGEPKYEVEHWVPVPGTDDIDKRDSAIIITETGLRVEDEKTRPMAWDFADIGTATYSYSKQPRWALGIALAVFICLPCLAFALFKKKQHWIAFEANGEPHLFKAHKNNYTAILLGLQRNGIEVQDITDVVDDAEQ